MISALIIFVRNPVLGKVKTRIAKDLGDTVALEIYKRLLSHTHSITAQRSNCTCRISQHQYIIFHRRFFIEVDLGYRNGELLQHFAFRKYFFASEEFFVRFVLK